MRQLSDMLRWLKPRRRRQLHLHRPCRLLAAPARAAAASDLFGDRAALAFLRIASATLRETAQDVQEFGMAVGG